MSGSFKDLWEKTRRLPEFVDMDSRFSAVLKLACVEEAVPVNSP
ncbi:MAG: hypothetical protein OXF02_02895 [Simkaniaceae bacterium]|nr:hypothetical protein [Simkaniaceae bacterium]